MNLKEIVMNLQNMDKGVLIPLCFGLCLTLVQIAPCTLNPWNDIFKWIGRKINSDLEDKLSDLTKQVEITQKDVEEHIVLDMRWHILNFAFTCRAGGTHTKEQWNYILDQAKKYELYIKRNNLSNGVVEEDTKYIRELYNKLSNEGKIV